MKTLYLDLIAQRAASAAAIADMTRKAANAEGHERDTWNGMLRQYIDAMPNLDGQIERARA